jgi:hypothetical protein
MYQDSTPITLVRDESISHENIQFAELHPDFARGEMEPDEKLAFLSISLLFVAFCSIEVFPY